MGANKKIFNQNIEIIGKTDFKDITDHHKKQSVNFVIHNAATDITAPVAGQVYYNTDDEHYYGYDGEFWKRLDNEDLENWLSDTAPQNVTFIQPSAGSATKAARADHVHKLCEHNHSNAENGGTISYRSLTDKPTISQPATEKPGEVKNSTSGKVGTETKYAREDHSHDLGTHNHSNDATGGTISHNHLTGLDNDDHHQYIKADGTRPFTGTVGGVDPTQAAHLATKAYVDARFNKTDWKDAVRVATTENVLSLSGIMIVDGISVEEGDRVLVRKQVNPQENGIYIVHNGAWSRSPDASDHTQVTMGLSVGVTYGDELAGTAWMLQVTDPVNVGVTPLEFIQIPGVSDIDGENLGSKDVEVFIGKEGNRLQFRKLAEHQNQTINIGYSFTDENEIVFMVNEANVMLQNLGGVLPIVKGGTGATTVDGALTNFEFTTIGKNLRLIANPAEQSFIRINQNGTIELLTLSQLTTAIGATKKYSANIGSITANSNVLITHNLGTQDVIVQIRRASSPFDIVEFDVEIINTTQVRIWSPISIAANEYKVSVIG